MVWVGKKLHPRAHSKLLAANKPTSAVGPARRLGLIKCQGLWLAPFSHLAETIPPGCNLGEFHVPTCMSRSSCLSQKVVIESFLVFYSQPTLRWSIVSLHCVVTQYLPAHQEF